MSNTIDESIDKWPFLMVLKGLYIQYMNEQYTTDNQPVSDEYIELYHATNSGYLKSILEHGLRPNPDKNYWKENEFPPMKNAVYLTNKWRYYFAATSYLHYQEDRLRDNEMNDMKMRIEKHLMGKQRLKGKETVFPIILKVRVPKSRLLPDEDYFLTKEMNDTLSAALESRGITLPSTDELLDDMVAATNKYLPKDEGFYSLLGFTPSMNELGLNCLDRYGTTTVYGGIDVNDIVEIQCFPSMRLIEWSLLDDKHPYRIDYHTWQKGLGTGMLTLAEVERMKIELPRMDITINKRLGDIDYIEADYDKKKTKVYYKS